MKHTHYLSVLMLAVSASASFANVIENTFDEPSFQPADGLTHNGVTFGFTIDGANSDDADYGSFGPGTLTYIADPSLVGNSSGLLTLDFEIPTPLLEFGAALNTAAQLSPGFTVELLDAGMSAIGVFDLDTVAADLSLGFSEALFQYAGDPVSRASIDFGHAPGSFAFDNLVYQVPEPGLANMAVFLFGILYIRRWIDEARAWDFSSGQSALPPVGSKEPSPDCCRGQRYHTH